MAKSEARSGAVNKAELIRQTARSMGKTVRPRDIIAKLKEQGVVVSSPQVSKTLKAAGFQRKSRGRKSTAAKSASANGAARHGARHRRAAHRGAVNKAERIRQVAKALGKKVRPRDIVSTLASEGISVSSGQVSTTLRAAGYRRRRRGKRVHADGAASRHGSRSHGGNGLNLEALLAAKSLIQTAGSIAVAEEAIRAIKKLV
jgi:arginine repressor